MKRFTTSMGIFFKKKADIQNIPQQLLFLPYPHLLFFFLGQSFVVVRNLLKKHAKKKHAIFSSVFFLGGLCLWFR